MRCNRARVPDTLYTVARPYPASVRLQNVRAACSDPVRSPVSCGATASTFPDSFQPEEPSQSGRKKRSESELKWAKLRGTVFLTFSMAIAIPLFCIMLAIYPLVWIFDRHRRRAEHMVNKFWAWSSTVPFNKVTVRARPRMSRITPFPPTVLRGKF